MIDSHAHLDDKVFDKDRDDVVLRARQAGLEAIICVYCVSADSASVDKFAGIIGGDGFIYGAAGIHPHDAADAHRLWKILEAALMLPGIVALGEIGLDYHYDNSPREVQKEIFAAQLRFAREKKLPVIIHSREADEDTIALLKENIGPQDNDGGTKGVMHCYCGSSENLKTFLEMGFYVSIAGPVTFPNAGTLRDAAASIPAQRLLMETDCPYLAPQPVRGRRNEPAYIKYTADKIAAIRGIGRQQLCSLTADNTRALFRLGPQTGKE